MARRQQRRLRRASSISTRARALACAFHHALATVTLSHLWRARRALAQRRRRIHIRLTICKLSAANIAPPPPLPLRCCVRADARLRQRGARSQAADLARSLRARGKLGFVRFSPWRALERATQAANCLMAAAPHTHTLTPSALTLLARLEMQVSRLSLTYIFASAILYM